MEQQNNSGVLNDTAGVLPMDTGATMNGIHDENHPLSSNPGTKKGRGRPPKSAGSTKGNNHFDTPKRARGRPPKTVESPSLMKKVVVTKKKNENSSINGDSSGKKRGRPSKSSTSNEQTNGISKPQIQSMPLTSYQEQEEENVNEPAKRKRGRPFGSSPKKAAVVAKSSSSSSSSSSSPPPPPSKEVSSTKKRGRPSGTAGIKKFPLKPKANVSVDGSVKKRGRPKKSSGTAVATSTNNETATVTSNNVQ